MRVDLNKIIFEFSKMFSPKASASYPSPKNFSFKKLLYLGISIIPVFIFIFLPSYFYDDQNSAKPSFVHESHALASAGTQLIDTLPLDKELPDIQVTSAFVGELGSNAPLFVYRPRARWPIASISKLMTAVVAREEFESHAVLTVSESALETEGGAGELKVGERYTVSDLIKLMLTVSSNDAATVIAEAYDEKVLGKEAFNKAISKTALFTEKMRAKAHALGMNETYFGGPTGLSMINQSVVGDLAVLASFIQRTYPEFFSITTNQKTAIVEQARKSRRILGTINQFAGRADFLGGKTGFTEEAGQGLLSLFSIKNKVYLIIVLGTEDRFGESLKLRDWVEKMH